MCDYLAPQTISSLHPRNLMRKDSRYRQAQRMGFSVWNGEENSRVVRRVDVEDCARVYFRKFSLLISNYKLLVKDLLVVIRVVYS